MPFSELGRRRIRGDGKKMQIGFGENGLQMTGLGVTEILRGCRRRVEEKSGFGGGTKGKSEIHFSLFSLISFSQNSSSQPPMAERITKDANTLLPKITTRRNNCPAPLSQR